MILSAAEKQLLTRIKESRRFTVVRLELLSSKQPSLVVTAFNHLHLDSPSETIEQARETAALLQSLAENGIIRICYHLPVSARSDFQIYADSDIFASLCALVEEGAKKPGFLSDSARIRRGVATITAKGRALYYR